MASAVLLCEREKGGYMLVDPLGKPARQLPEHEAMRDVVWKQTRAILDERIR